MAGVVGRVADTRRELKIAMVGHGPEERQRAFGVLHGVERRGEAVRKAVRLAMLHALIEELGVLLLNVGGVAQHPIAQVDGSRRGVNGAMEPVLYEGGEVAAVIDVGVREHDGVDRSGVEGQVSVLGVGIAAPALVQPAIEQVSLAPGIHQMLGTGHFSRRTAEREFHSSLETQMVAQ